MIRRPRKKFGGALGEAFEELWEAVEAGQIVESDFVSVDKTSRGVIVRARDGGGFGGGGIGDDGEQGEAGEVGATGAVGPVGQSTNSIYLVTNKRLLSASEFFFNQSNDGMAKTGMLGQAGYTQTGKVWWLFDRKKVAWDDATSTLQTYYVDPAVALDGHEPEVGPDFPLPPIIPQGEYNLMADTSDLFVLYTQNDPAGAADFNLYYTGIANTVACPVMKTLNAYGFGYFDYL